MRVLLLLLALLLPLTAEASFGFGSTLHTFDSAGGTFTENIQSGQSWSVSGLPSHVTTNAPLSGTGPATLEFAVAPLISKSARFDLLNITGLPVGVYQEGIDSRIREVSNLPASGGPQIDIGVTEDPASFFVDSTFSDLIDLDPNDGSFSDVFLDVEANPLDEFRYIRIRDAVTGYQTVMNQPSADSFSVSTNSLDFIDPVTTATITVTTDPATTWLAYSDAPWATIEGPPVRTGSAVLTITYDHSYVTYDRLFSTLFIGPEEVVVNAPFAPVGMDFCTIKMDDLNIVDNSGGEFTVWVNQSLFPGHEGCTRNYPPEADDPWITIVDSSSIHVTYQVDPNNTGESRSGMIQIAPGNIASHAVIQTNVGKSGLGNQEWLDY